MIIASARTLIGDQGLSATTLRDVARAADVALGTVTYHFSGIAEVLHNLGYTVQGSDASDSANVKRLRDKGIAVSAPITETAAAAPTGAAGLAVIADGLLAADERAAQHWRLWLDFWALAAHVPRYGAWQSEIYRELHDVVAELLERGHWDGSLTIRDPKRQAIEFVALLDGLVVQCYLPHPRISPDDARAILKSHAGA